MVKLSASFTARLIGALATIATLSPLPGQAPAGPNVMTAQEVATLQRNCNVEVSYPSTALPAPTTTRVLWAENMKQLDSTWTSAGGAQVSSDGEHLIVQGPCTGSELYQEFIKLPTEFDFKSFPYLTMRMRASQKAAYFIRLHYNDGPVSAIGVKTALEGRRGLGIGDDSTWETCTFNIRTLQQTYGIGLKKMNKIELVLMRNVDDPPAPGTNLRLELDWMCVNAGILPDTLSPTETNFGNNLDDNGDFQVDRDDPAFRANSPRLVFATYQTFTPSILTPDGFGGKRQPGAGQSGIPVTVDPFKFSPNNSTKRQVRSTFYPLDFVRNPNYEPPTTYNEFWDQNTNGIWADCQAPYMPPTEQFPTLNYDILGSLEEYNVLSSGWAWSQAELARKYQIDGFMYNDGGLNTSLGTEGPMEAMTTSCNQGAAGLWANKPFQLASFYNLLPYSTQRSQASDVVTDLAYIMGYRANAVNAYSRFRNKPLVFVLPTRNAATDKLSISLADWEKVFTGLLNIRSNNFDGAMSLPYATPGASNVLSFTFDTATSFSGSLERLVFLDRDLKFIKEMHLGTPQARALLHDGWGTDVVDAPPSNFTYTQIYQTGAGKPGYASMQLDIPVNACYLQVRMRCIAPQQHCELRVNNEAGAPAVKFATRLDWNLYIFRMRDLPASFTTSGVADTPYTELPVSLWGDISQLVQPTSRPTAATRGFDGFATYPSNFIDSRVEVSYPYLHASTVRPSFDDSGFFSYCNSSRQYFYPRMGGQTYRHEWEELLQTGADMAVIGTWNEFAEGTNIEPDIEHGYNPLRLTQTYTLMYKGLVETGKWPSQTNFTVYRWDTDGQNRTVEFRLNGADTIRLNGLKFGLNGGGITSIKRNGQPVMLASAEAQLTPNVLTPQLIINAPAMPCTYVISYSVADPLTVSGPDLTGQFVGVASSVKTSKRGTTVSIKGTLYVQSIGSVDPPSCTITYYLSPDGVTLGTPVGKPTASGRVKIGKPVKKSINITLPAGTTATGKYLIAVLDSGSIVAERYESNNRCVAGPLN